MVVLRWKRASYKERTICWVIWWTDAMLSLQPPPQTFFRPCSNDLSSSNSGCRTSKGRWLEVGESVSILGILHECTDSGLKEVAQQRRRHSFKFFQFPMRILTRINRWKQRFACELDVVNNAFCSARSACYILLYSYISQWKRNRIE